MSTCRTTGRPRDILPPLLPRAHAPADPALDAIRDGAIYPRLNPAYNQIHTVYGPVATVAFAGCVRAPGDAVWNVRVLMTLCDLLTLGVLLLLLGRCGLSRAWALVYALNPLLLDSFAQRG